MRQILGLSLTDEDASEYKTFEAITSLLSDYRNNKVMLCTFHAIWKYFKLHIRPSLPKQGLILSKSGCHYGKNEYTSNK